MDHLRITSTRLQAVVFILIFLVPCTVALNAVTAAWAELLSLPQGIILDTSRISGLSLLAVLVLGLIKPVCYMLAFWFVYQLLGLYREGIIFTAENVSAIRRIGWAIAAIDIAGMFQTVITGPVLTYFEISSAYLAARLDVGFLIIGLFVVLIAHVMDMGRELKEHDNLVI